MVASRCGCGVAVVPANAGTHTPRRLDLASLFDGFRPTTKPCGYGFRLSPERRESEIGWCEPARSAKVTPMRSTAKTVIQSPPSDVAARVDAPYWAQAIT